MSINEKKIDHQMDLNEEKVKRDLTSEMTITNDLTDEEGKLEETENNILQDIGEMIAGNEEVSQAVINFVKDLLFSFLLEMNSNVSKEK